MSNQYKEILIEREDKSRWIVRIFEKENFKGDALVQIRIFEGITYVNTTIENLSLIMLMIN